MEVVPTRRNGKTRVEEIAKRLDKSYVSEDLISSSVRYTSWVDYPYISDHAPVLLQLGNSILIVAHSFKLNLAWLREDTFATLVQEVWYDYQFQQEEGAQRRLVGNLKQLKNWVKSWSKEKILQEQLALDKLEEELAFHYKQKTRVMFSFVTEHRLMFL
jgi:hypothetical protein